MRPEAASLLRQTGAVRPASPQPAGARQMPAMHASFADSLAEAQAGLALKFSAHATQRLAERQIRFTPAQIVRVQQAADLAARRGSRDALLMLDNLGLVVNVGNRTVLTALDLKTMNDGIVTNIDSAVLVRTD